MTTREPLYPHNYRSLVRRGGQSVAVAIEAPDMRESDGVSPDAVPEITASGRGKLADQIVEIALANGVKVREDCALAEILAQLDLDTPIPSEAIVLVAEILAKVYEANQAAPSFETKGMR